MVEPATTLVTTTVDLLRHAECEGGAIFRGSLDVALTAQGWERMQRATAGGHGWQRIVSSPLQRCRAFAERLAGARGLYLQVEPRLREMSFGDWEGRAVADIWQTQAETAAAWIDDPEAHPPPNGEPLGMLRERAGAALADLLQQARGAHVLVLTHGGVMRALIGQALSMPPAAINRLDVPWACISRLAFTHGDDGDTVRLLGHNMGAP